MKTQFAALILALALSCAPRPGHPIGARPIVDYRGTRDGNLVAFTFDVPEGVRAELTDEIGRGVRGRLPGVRFCVAAGQVEWAPGIFAPGYREPKLALIVLGYYKVGPRLPALEWEIEHMVLGVDDNGRRFHVADEPLGGVRWWQ